MVESFGHKSARPVSVQVRALRRTSRLLSSLAMRISFEIRLARCCTVRWNACSFSLSHCRSRCTCTFREALLLSAGADNSLRRHLYGASVAGKPDLLVVLLNLLEGAGIPPARDLEVFLHSSAPVGLQACFVRLQVHAERRDTEKPPQLPDHSQAPASCAAAHAACHRWCPLCTGVQ